MTRTDLDAATLARMLRMIAGDGSVEWVMEPVQAVVLHDMADMLDELDALRELLEDLWPRAAFTMTPRNRKGYEARMVELGIEVEL